MTLLQAENLSIEFQTPDGVVKAVNDVSFSIGAGETVALVGESGSGKSQIALSVLGLLAGNARTSGTVTYQGKNLLEMQQNELNSIRAKEIAMIFQDPMTSLNPYMTIERQLNESLEQHEGLKGAAARKRVLEAMDAVRIPDAKNRLKAYPHEFSGGMRQRIVIAMALMCSPKLILADEPTTALDVTVQAQIMALLKEIQRESDMSVLLITHDLGVVAGACEKTLVLYAGRVMEQAGTLDLFETPSHPYTRGLLRAVPNIQDAVGDLRSIAGQPPNQMVPPPGCPFAPRCENRTEQCDRELPPLVGDIRHQRACWRPVEELV
ncbi:oligopeptide transport system ATP-binding protein [Pacificibacter maritimus]|uniref:Oligopeptide transport system ATP-binding protein n=1 Tax=Pacificibacter maritimus TaxID=762213 RepID=A0A3N4UYE0_9RHOB|nr:ABC transporter ATP-binding protein [Pacificibacter maritimus]RPE66590.1 oligopeptide transport system ATP-binding protein [Pacificibacter maritimus]